MVVGTAWWSTEDGGEITVAEVLSEGSKSGVFCTSDGGCETDGCVEVPSAARGRALVTGRNTVLPFSISYVERFQEELQA